MSHDTIEILIQLGVSAALVLLMTVIHGVGLLAVARFLRLKKERLEERTLDAGAFVLMGAVGMSIFALHTLEIWVFAGFYMLVGAIDTLKEALFYSASAYATLGRPTDFFPDEWRLIGALEALVGFVLIGWSTAFIVSTMNRLRRTP